MKVTKLDEIKKAITIKCPKCKKKMLFHSKCENCGFDDTPRFKGQPPPNYFVG